MKVDWSLDISTAIDDALKAKGMTRKEFALALGTSAAVVSRWLSGTHNFKLSTLARISAVLGVPLINITKSKNMRDLSYYAMYLKNHLKEVGDPRSADDEFLSLAVPMLLQRSLSVPVVPVIPLMVLRSWRWLSL